MADKLHVQYGLAISTFGFAVLAYAKHKGPYRAFCLARASKAWQAPVHSVRKAQVELVRNKLSTLSGESFLVVRGPKGVGKTCIVDTVLETRPGVVRLDIYPGTSGPEILKKVFSAISGNISEGHQASAKDVLKWYNRLYSKYPFVIALQAKERSPPSPCADIGPAARDLGAFGFQVLVDASQHALGDKETERERYVEIDFMSRDSLFSIPEFQQFYKNLKECELKEELWEILGGNPNKLKNLVDECVGKKDIKEIVVEFLLRSLEDAVKSVNEELIRTPELADEFLKYQTQDSIYFRNIKLSISEIKSLRIVGSDFVPMNPTVGFVLRIGLEGMDNILKDTKGASVEEKVCVLKRLVSQAKNSSVNNPVKPETEENSQAFSPNQK
jgi:hypothetical protein